MNDLKEILENRLEEKQKEYNIKHDLFATMCETEKETSCFEENAISLLIALKQTKSEINQIKDIIMLITLCDRS